MHAKQAKADPGFTLIELIIVVVILGILAAIVVFAVGTTTSSSAQSACKADAKSVEIAQEAYKAANNGSYAANLGALVPTYLRETISGGTHYAITTNSSGQVLVVAPNPASGAPAAVDFVTTPTVCNSAT